MKFYFLFLVFSIITGTNIIAQNNDSTFVGNWHVVLDKSPLKNAYWNKRIQGFPNEISIANDTIKRIKNINQSSYKSEDFFVEKKDLDSLKFLYYYNDWNLIGRSNDLWGKGDLKKVSKTLLVGTYLFKTRDSTLIVRMRLERMWCCGNHNPQHCDKDITKECTKIH